MVTRDSHGRSAHIADRAPAVEVRCDDRELLGVKPDREFSGTVGASRPMSAVHQRLGPAVAEPDWRRGAHPVHRAIRRCPYRRKKGRSATSPIKGPCEQALRSAALVAMFSIAGFAPRESVVEKVFRAPGSNRRGRFAFEGSHHSPGSEPWSAVEVRRCLSAYSFKRRLV